MTDNGEDGVQSPWRRVGRQVMWLVVAMVALAVVGSGAAGCTRAVA